MTGWLAERITSLGVVRAAVDDTDEFGDKGTADPFTGISRALDKYLWFLEAHLQEKT